jgi:zinc transport system substrate-binding protein
MAMLRRLLLSIVLTLAVVASARGEPPRVVASIVPMHSLAAAVMEGVGAPDLLLKGGASPHGYALRPSDATALEGADLIFWIGPEMEGFLEKPLDTLGSGVAAVRLIDTPGLTLLPAREGGVWEPDSHEDEHEHEHEHEHGETDGHIWLDPANAAVLAARMAEALAAVDPDNAARYRDNAAALQARLSDLTSELRTALEPVRNRPFIVFHDAYHYFEHAFGLAAAGSITVSPDRPPSAKRLVELRQAIVDRGAVCVFGEPRTRTDLVVTVAEESGAGTAELDAEGTSDLAPGPDAYVEMMRRLGHAVAGCLARAS